MNEMIKLPPLAAMIREGMADERMIAHFEQRPPRNGAILWFETLKYVLSIQAAVAVCNRLGHRWADDGSHAGPEGAEDNLVCRRCGAGLSHTYF